MADSSTKSSGGIGKYFSDLKNEIKKIVWPSRKDALRNTCTVLVSIVIMGTFVFIFDKAFGELFKRFMEMG
ncbi:MAG: preprotein translocase subunit SecE [Oscillospiraceae bacterium]|jgi:preprotein translocase subunit SecE|nr:preprotein translocase subunit SecE [Oscillospiraceae bacterium]